MKHMTVRLGLVLMTLALYSATGLLISWLSADPIARARGESVALAASMMALAFSLSASKPSKDAT